MDVANDRIRPGCEPFAAEGSGENARTGIVFVHGFSGSPDSMRPWAQYLNERGYTVDAILLPGHGTTWQDANTKTYADLQAAVDRAFEAMRSRTDRVFLMAMSYGSTLALHVAAARPQDVAGLVLVNPWVRPDGVAGWQRHLVPLQRHLARFVKGVPGVGSDIADPTGHELAYDKVPVELAVSLLDGWKSFRTTMEKVIAPVLLVRSLTDHVVGPNNSELIRAHVRSPLREVELQRSYHVATLDYDAERIFAESAEFVESLVPASE